MPHQLEGKTIAILAADGFEQSELIEPKQALEDAGARTEVVSLQRGEIRGWNEDHFDEAVGIDETVETANVDDYDALVLPGGLKNPDTLRQSGDAVRFVQDFFTEGKPVAAICHGLQMLIEADVVRDRTVTSYPSIKTDLINAGAVWVDQPVVVDEGLVTSRRPSDLPQFNAKMIEEIAEGVHEGQRSRPPR
jgi:protease I